MKWAYSKARKKWIRREVSLGEALETELRLSRLDIPESFIALERGIP
jgi:hypothetical protein